MMEYSDERKAVIQAIRKIVIDCIEALQGFDPDKGSEDAMQLAVNDLASASAHLEDAF